MMGQQLMVGVKKYYLVKQINYILIKDYKLPDEKVLFRDYINYLKELKKGNEYEKCKKYWQNRIKDLPPIPDLPTKQNNNSSNKLPEVRKFSRALSIEDYNKLEKISQKNGITVFYNFINCNLVRLLQDIVINKDF